MVDFPRIIAIGFILLYFLSPIDMIPDGIPGVGGLDDILVAIVAYRMVTSENEN